MYSTYMVELFKKLNFKVRLSICITSSVYHPVTSEFETGAGPNMKNKVVISTAFNSIISTVPCPGIVGDTEGAVVIQLNNPLHDF